MGAKNVIVHTWKDYCEWIRSHGVDLTKADEFDPTRIDGEFHCLQERHRELIEKYHSNHKIEYCDHKYGFIVFGRRS